MSNENMPPQGKLAGQDHPFVHDLRAAIITQKTPLSLTVIYLIMIIMISAGVWAHYAQVEEITAGEGTVIPASKEKIVQSLEGGILEALQVHEGEIVEKGAMLAKIDPTRATSMYREGASKILGLKGTIARLRAEAWNTPLEFPDDVKANASIVHNETQAWQARKRVLADSNTTLRNSLALAENEINLSAPLVKKGLMSEVELLRMKRQANDLRLQIAERENKFRAEANSDLVKYESELAQNTENLTARADMMNRTSLISPVRGTVNNINVTTLGGVIPQGGQVMTIIPLEDKLLIETRIKPADVAFLRPGLPATVKVTAYDYAIYGALQGTIESISPDTLKDEEKARQGRGDANYYRVYIRTDSAELKVKNKVFTILPGMLANVEIRTGKKTIMDYILKPVFKAREAFRER
ncbi:HlyD family type I secretion periplasmic adaptor subunit [Rahnella bruchi]|uniref:HlyD family type I secretion periplasmic adaptor subunit n=1 Tax=Rahnella bruchi TaxID=1510573 RepID=UPI000EA3A71E|nr:HlyD family type I secretion periplasmic adaptor subunit [Rahnella bruchi]